MTPILPGSAVGILGSGQLGRMLAIAARRMGYATHVFSPEKDSPAAAVCDLATVADYADSNALARFGQSVKVVTLEFENIPQNVVGALEAVVPVRPSAQILHIAQHRAREKTFLREKGFPHVPFALIESAKDVACAVAEIGTPSVLKTAGFGYDGKGQTKVTESQQIHDVVSRGGGPWVLEQWQDFEKEISVGVARGLDGRAADWGPVENRHRAHILDVSVAPATVGTATFKQAVDIAHGLARELSLVGVLWVEFFVSRDGTVRVNEMAPRPHNSGHWTIEGAATSQFEQQIRAVCGLPLGSTEILRPTAMANLLGDAWAKREPRWEAVLGDPWVKWHSYGKKEARPGRKMGHLTSLGTSTEQAVQRVLAAREKL